jgi:hypothetical protein
MIVIKRILPLSLFVRISVCSSWRRKFGSEPYSSLSDFSNVPLIARARLVAAIKESSVNAMLLLEGLSKDPRYQSVAIKYHLGKHTLSYSILRSVLKLGKRY